MTRFNTIVRLIARALVWVGITATIAMMLLAVSNILGRYLFNTPILGTFELVELMGGVAASSFLAYPLIANRHIYVELIVRRFSPRTQRFLIIFAALITAIMIFFIARQMTMYAQRSMLANHVTDETKTPHFPFMYYVCFCFIVVGLVFLREMFIAMREVVKK